MMEMDVYVMPLQTLHFTEAQEKLGNLIHYGMKQDAELSDYHRTNFIYKLYTFSSLSPIEKNGYYQEGALYRFIIRGTEEFLNQLSMVLDGLSSDDFYVDMTKITKVRAEQIYKLYTLNPAIFLKKDRSYVLPDDEEIKVAILTNATNKYKRLYNEEIQHDFIDSIKIISRKPVVTKYKGIRMLGTKMEIYIKQDPFSQQLARLVSIAGVGEKNSVVGAGFCYVY